MSPPPATVLGSVDRAAFAVALSGRLRARGVPVGLTGAEDFVRALGAASPDTRSALYWTARVTLVRRHGDLGVFDAVFAAVFDDAVLDMDPHARRTPLARTVSADESLASLGGDAPDLEAGTGLPWLTLPPTVGDADDSDSDLAVPERLPSELAGLADVGFEDLTALEMRLLGEWLERAVPAWPTRRTRRMAEQHNGHRVAVRATIARSRRTGWEPIELVRVRAVRKPRPVVMVCDVSQSMQAQATAYFHLMRALALTADAEIFAFATTLTRLTHVLSHRSAETAIELATERVVDRFGGTRIATNLTALLSSHHGGSLRGAIVIVASDGWDSDPPEQLAAAMARLRRRAYRVIWINPRASAPGFEPRVATMAAALPYCDRLLPADTFRSLGQVIAEVAISSALTRGLSSTASRGWTGGTARP